MNPIIRPFREGDEAPIVEIYNHYLTQTTITFEETALTEKQMHERIKSHLVHYPWWVCEREGIVVGYSYASPFHPRSAYRYTAETTLYVRAGFERQGIGKALYAPLIAHLTPLCHSLVALIALPNTASVALHESFNFKKVGHLTQVGRKFNRWVDVGYWQKTLDGNHPLDSLPAY